jgi:hypothetical protein
MWHAKEEEVIGWVIITGVLSTTEYVSDIENTTLH